MKTSTKIIAAISAAVAISLSGYGVFQLSKSRTFQLFGNLVSRMDTDRKVVALTFDDAPSEHTDEVLKVLQENDVKATFFAIGQSLEKYPDQARAIVQAGHELGNHTYSHKRMVFRPCPSSVTRSTGRTT